jgi:hypothetical protein
MQLRSKHGPHTHLDCLVDWAHSVGAWLLELEQLGVLVRFLVEVGLQENQWLNY